MVGGDHRLPQGEPPVPRRHPAVLPHPVGRLQPPAQVGEDERPLVWGWGGGTALAEIDALPEAGTSAITLRKSAGPGGSGGGVCASEVRKVIETHRTAPRSRNQLSVAVDSAGMSGPTATSVTVKSVGS